MSSFSFIPANRQSRCNLWIFVLLFLLCVGATDGQVAYPTSKPADTSRTEQVLTPPVEVFAPITTKTRPSTFIVPITVDDVSSDAIIAFQFNITFDNGVIDPTGDINNNFGCDTTGTIAANLAPTCNIIGNTLLVSVSGVQPITAAGGTILNIPFATDSLAVPGNFSPLTFTQVFFFRNTGRIANIPHSGQITLVGPTAANASISGRVITADGRGIRNAIVVVGSSQGAQRMAVTSPFGYYRIDGLASGETYIVSLSSKRYQFTPRIISLVDDLTDVDFTAEP